jgi:histone-lysine N-methyltransferase SETMAR
MQFAENVQAREVLLHYDNARPHTARATLEIIQDLQWKLLEHPPYSPGLAPSDFHFFGPLKNDVGGKRYANDKERLKRRRGNY